MIICMTTPNLDTYCSLAFTGYDTRTKSVCCWAELDRNASSFIELKNNTNLLQLQQDLISGVKNPICNACWRDEELNLHSMRMCYTVHKDMQEVLTEISEKKLKHLVIDSGNVCNLSCRTCGPWASSAHFNERVAKAKKLNLPPYVNRVVHTNVDGLLREDYSNITSIAVLGGEPFLNLEHLAVLEKIVSDGYSKNCSLTYTSNGTVKLPLKVIELFNQFKDTYITLSIDAIGDRFKYIRTTGEWNDVVSNLNYLRTTQLHNHISAHTTISALNILYLDELFDWFMCQDIPYDFVFCDNPTEYSFEIFNDTAKSRVIEHLSKSSHDTTSIIKQLANAKYNQDSLNTFWQEIEFTHEFRKLNSIDYINELLELLTTAW